MKQRVKSNCVTNGLRDKVLYGSSIPSPMKLEHKQAGQLSDSINPIPDLRLPHIKRKKARRPKMNMMMPHHLISMTYQPIPENREEEMKM